MNNNDLRNKILDLINSKRKGDFWDFKEEPHENKALILHDILCLANSHHNGEKFLIYGVTDPEYGAIIKGLTTNQKNRKTQVQFIDFLRTRKPKILNNIYFGTGSKFIN